ncbi:MAG TPA: ParB/RepB/Spo0J family partition protein [Gammaproteobacteria bacterium]|nr:ParB/RepB/Spo0J family partition protein [Gammaproteobacteria bacterium]
MAIKKRGLGRGLDALLGSVATAPDQPKESRDGELREIAVELLQRGRYQPRTDIHQESLEELADSIREQGLVQPIVVRPVGQGKYEIIAGERRWRAAQMAGLQEVPAVVRNVNDRAAIAMALIENIQRENLNPMEESRSLHRLMEEFELTQQQAAEAVGRSRSGVANLLRLHELNEDVKTLLEKRELEMGHARALLALKGQQQSAVAKKVASVGMSVRETEQLVRKLGEPAKPGPTRKDQTDPNIRRLQDDISEKLGASVQLQCKPNGKGRLVISFNSNDELEGILAHIK